MIVRLMKRTWARCILALLLIVVLLIGLSQIDDALEPEGQALLDDIETTGTSQAYLYLLGMDAPAESSPVEAGQELLDAVREREQAPAEFYENNAMGDWPGFAGDDARLPLPEGELFCRLTEPTCIPALLSAEPDVVAGLLSEHDVLMSRYRTLMAMEDFRSLASPRVDEPIPNYQYLMRGTRLLILDALSQAEQGSPEASIQQLSNNLARARTQLARADGLVGKMVYLSLVSEHLDILSLMLARHGYSLGPDIPPMTISERDFSSAMAREFAMGYVLYQALDRQPDFFDENVPTPGWFVRAVFKPNMSSNAMLPMYLPVIELSRMAPDDFAAAVGQHEPVELPTAWIRNPAGTLLNNVARPDLVAYLARVYDIDGKISLLNQIITAKGVPEDLSDLDNPLSESANGVYWSESGQSLCLEGPREDRHGLRCLPVVFSFLLPSDV